MSDALRRTLRTFIQAFLGAILTSGVLSAIATDGVVDVSILGKTAASALAAGIIAVITFLQNYLEDNEVIPEVIAK